MSQPPIHPDTPAGTFDEEGVSRPAAPTGHMVIRDYLPRLPDRPGVYRMLDTRGGVLYVGKARTCANGLRVMPSRPATARA